MAYKVHQTEQELVLELKGAVTARDAAELGRSLASAMSSGASTIVRAGELEDIDTCVLQMLVSLSKTAASFVVDVPSEAFACAVDRCALGAELLNGSRGSR